MTWGRLLGVMALLWHTTSVAAASERGESASAGAQLVDVSRQQVFSMRWWRPVVPRGFYRQVELSFGAPAISTRLGVVVVASATGAVVGLRLADGHLLWQLQYASPFATAATVVAGGGEGPSAGELALVGSQDGTLVAVQVASGAVAWQARLEGEMRAAPVVWGERALVATTANKLFLLDVRSGQVAWSRGRAASAGLTVEGCSRPAVDVAKGVAYATFADGYAVAFALADGQPLWERPLSLSGKMFADADADVLLADGQLFVASYSDGVYALDPTSGQTLWSHGMAAVVSLAGAEGMVVAGTADGTVVGLDRATGQVRFRTTAPFGAVSRLQVRYGLLLATVGGGGLMVLRASDGAPLQMAALGGEEGAGDPAWEGEHVAVLGRSGTLFLWRFNSFKGGKRV